MHLDIYKHKYLGRTETELHLSNVQYSFIFYRAHIINVLVETKTLTFWV